MGNYRQQSASPQSAQAVVTPRSEIARAVILPKSYRARAGEELFGHRLRVARSGTRPRDCARPTPSNTTVEYGRFAMPDFPAISHAAITVSDLARSTEWYTALIGSD